MKNAHIIKQAVKLTLFTVFIFCMSMLFSTEATAQTAPGVEWANCYGGFGLDIALDVVQDNQGNYFMCGITYSGNGDVTGFNGEADVWVVKADSEGNLVWQNSLGGSYMDFGYGLTLTPDGGCIVVGETGSNDGDVSGHHGPADLYPDDAWVVKLDAGGNLVWQKCMGSTGMDGAFDVVATADGNYLLSGYVEFADGDASSIKGGGDAWFVKFDGAGNILWERTYGGSESDGGGKIFYNSAGEIFSCGTSHSEDGDVTEHHGTNEYPDIWILKTGPGGKIIWETTLGGKGEDYPGAIIELPDGSLLVSGATNSTDGDVSFNHGIFDYWLVKLNAQGQIIWENTYGGAGSDLLRDFISSGEANFLLIGGSYSTDGDIEVNFGGEDQWVVKVDGNGIIQWSNNYGGSNNDEALSGLIHPDGNLVLAGCTDSHNGQVSNHHGYRDYWLVKTGTPTHTITTGDIEANELCPGSKLKVPYSATGTFNPGNIFTAQLSNFYGEFNIPADIGSVSSTEGGVIQCILPAVADHDAYRIRVVSSDLVVYGFDNGEFLSIRCPAPENLSVTNITATSAILKWEGNTDCKVKFTVRYRSVISGAWITVNNIIGTSLLISNLSPATTYQWEVRTKCKATDSKSSFVTGADFITPPLKTVPDGPTLDNFSSGFTVYPNPFSASSSIQFFLPSNSPVKIELLDLQGRKIKTIAEGNFEAGNHQLNLSAHDLPNGIYLLKLHTNEKTFFTKLIKQ